MISDIFQKALTATKTAARALFEAFLGASTKRKIAIIAVLFIMIGVTAETFNKPEVAQPVLKYSDYKSALELSPIDRSKCNALQDELASSDSLALATKNFAAAKRASEKLTVWNASEFVGETAWMELTPSLLEDFVELVRGSSDTILAERVSELKDAEAANSFAEQPDVWSSTFASFMVSNCELDSFYKKSADKIRSYVGFKSSIQSLASNKPWYPKGYEETGFPGFAYKNISNQGCRYSFGSCAKFKIVSQTDCPSNLYVKTNFLDNGAVVDWSNDTAVVRAGQVAVMETTFTSEAGNQWEFVEITCY